MVLQERVDCHATSNEVTDDLSGPCDEAFTIDIPENETTASLLRVVIVIKQSLTFGL